MRLSFILCCLLVPGTALADKVVCEDPVDNAARLGIPGSLNYSLTEDDDRRECRFSVEGVAAGSPPQELLDQAASQLRNRENLIELAQRDTEALLQSVAFMLAAASPTEEPDPTLFIAENEALLQECIFNGFDGVGGFVGGNSRDTLTCSVVNADTLDEFNFSVSSGSVRVEELDGTRIVVRNERGPLTEYLFLRAF